jgi:antitoxin component YwqK of YwqJK toxin-antitoxin module
MCQIKICQFCCNVPTEEKFYDVEKTKIKCKIWRNNDNQLHRDNEKPAKIWYFENGNVYREEYWINDILHRDNDKPAIVWYFTNGNIQMEEFLVNNKVHRDNNKPAVVRYFENGDVDIEEYWVNGVKIN